MAAERGHRVTLWEREVTLGGRLALAATLRLREDFGLWLGFAQRRLERLGVVCRFGVDVTVEPVVHRLAAGAHQGAGQYQPEQNQPGLPAQPLTRGHHTASKSPHGRKPGDGFEQLRDRAGLRELHALIFWGKPRNVKCCLHF